MNNLDWSFGLSDDGVFTIYCNGEYIIHFDKDCSLALYAALHNYFHSKIN